MNTAILVLIILILVHWIYESVIAPAKMVRIRYKLFSLRDDLRYISYKDPARIDSKLFSDIDSGISNSIRLVSYLHLTTILRFQYKYNNDSEFRNEINSGRLVQEDIDDQEIKSIIDQWGKAFYQAFLINSFGLIIYLLPLIIVISPFYVIFKGVDRFGMWVKKFIFVPEKELNIESNELATIKVRAHGHAKTKSSIC